MKRLATRKLGEMKLEEGKALPVVHRGKRNILEIEADRNWAVRQVSLGRTYQEIADELNEGRGYSITKEQVRVDIEKAIVEWKRENMENIDVMVGRELARIEEIERIVMSDYEKSKNLKAVDYAALMKRGLSVDEIDAMFEGKMPGNYQYMETMLHLQMQKLKILGIDRGNDVPTNTIVQYNFGSLNDVQLAALADRLQDEKSAELLREIAVEEQ